MESEGDGVSDRIASAEEGKYEAKWQSKLRLTEDPVVGVQREFDIEPPDGGAPLDLS